MVTEERQRQWWGRVGGRTFHLFDGVRIGAGAGTRLAEKAACGWAPPNDVLEPPPDNVRRLLMCTSCVRRSRW